MSNSSLVCYIKISPNSSPRTSKIDSIVIHHAGCIQTIEVLGAGFLPRWRKASSTYGVGSDGRIGQYVDESRRPMTSNNWQIDDRSITIEVSNDTLGPDWHVSDKALESTIALCVDICQRNGIERINYTGDKTGNLHKHKWYWWTGCPGPYLGSKFPYIAAEINKRLGVSGPVISVPEEEEKKEEAPVSALSVGDTVTLTTGARYTTGKLVPSWVLQKTLYVRKIAGDDITVSIFKTGAVTGIVNEKYIQKST